MYTIVHYLTLQMDFPERDNEWIFSPLQGPLIGSRLKLVHHSMYTVLKERKQSLTFL